MAKSPLDAATDLMTLSISTEGKHVPDSVGIVAIEIEQAVNESDQAFIIINDGSLSGKDFQVTNSKTFKPERNIEIKLGYHTKNTTVFKGSIKGQLLTDNTNTIAQLHVICNSNTNAVNSIRHADVDIYKVPALELTYGKDVMEFELLLSQDKPKHIEGFVSFQGSAMINVNDMLELRGFADTFNIKYAVTKVIHHVSDGDWITTAFISRKL